MFNCSARGSNVAIEWMVDRSVKVASESQSSDAPCFSMTTQFGDSHLVQSILNCSNTSSLTGSYRVQCTVSQNVYMEVENISQTAYLFVKPGEFKCMHSFLFLFPSSLVLLPPSFLYAFCYLCHLKFNVKVSLPVHYTLHMITLLRLRYM